jgi:hypothetical protein
MCVCVCISAHIYVLGACESEELNLDEIYHCDLGAGYDVRTFI